VSSAGLLIGYGAFALAHATIHLRHRPPCLRPSPRRLLTAVTITGVVAAKAQRGARGRDAVIGKMLPLVLVASARLFFIIPR